MVKRLIVMILFLVFITLLTQQMPGLTVAVDITEGVDQGFAWTVPSALNAAQFFLRILTFQVEGLPAIINLLVFWPLTIGILLMIIGIIRGNLVL